MKKKHLILFYFILFFTGFTYAQQPLIQGKLKELFAGPATSENQELWISKMKKWRVEEKNKLNYKGVEYSRPEFGWIKQTFIYAQMMAHDRYIYDPTAGKYTVDRYVNDVIKRYGGLDAVLIWPTYPNIGIDNRNQYDLVADMPGGFKAIKQMIIDFKKRGVRVFFPIMIWDHGTRKIAMEMPVGLMKEMKLLGADGMNGDTMWGVTEDFRNAYDSLGYPIALQPEVAIKDLKMVEWNTMSWGYYWDYTYVPGISIYKWLEPRHQVQVTNRWAIDKTDDLQYAFFNGIGYNAWENIWGIWNQIPDRYEEAIRRIASIYREFPDIWSTADWEPYFPTLQKGIFSSKFSGSGQTIYTLVNRDSVDTHGRQLQLPYEEHMLYYDVWNGTALTASKKNDSIYLSIPIESRGFGAILGIKATVPDTSFNRFLHKMHSISRLPLKSFSTAWKPLPQQIVPIKRTRPAQNVPEGMVLIPSIRNYTFESKGVMIEGDALPTAVGVQHPWEEHPGRYQKKTMEIASFYIDKYPVTNQQFKKFMDVTKYQPKDRHNFLKDWNNNIYPKGWDKKPVTWISIEDARAFAAWAGKRLPHEWEWQYAAQGKTGSRFPWGNTFDSTRLPSIDTSREMREPTDVNAFPQGGSSFGLIDMVGNVWQWTDEYIDAHTRSAILKGGGYYRSTTSKWYFPRIYELNEYGKYLLMSPSIDRSATIGFRCAMDK